MTDTDREGAMAGAILLGFLGLVTLFAGVWVLFGIGWALVVVGAVFTIDSWVMGLGRKRGETLLFAGNNNN